MTPTARFILCAAVLAYLAGDLFVFNGPLNRSIQTFHPDSPRSVAKAREKGIVARVHQRPISKSQLERAATEHLWLQGKSLADLPAEEQQAARKLALEDLIEQQLLVSEMERSGTVIDVAAADVDERLKRLVGRFESKGELETSMKSQGISAEKDLRDRVAAQIRAERFIESRIAPEVAVSAEDAKKWYEANQQQLATPERLEARHIFIATLETPAEDAKKKLDEALAALTAKQKDFPTLAKELSQDPANKDTGGNLGWMTRQRLAPDFAEPVFSLAINQPTLIRTKLGWHLVEVIARKAAEPRAFEDAKAEVTAALEAEKRREAVKTFRSKLRQDAQQEIRIIEPSLL
jgi:parvulin-like peptidyl-prolyl isomerase